MLTSCYMLCNQFILESYVAWFRCIMVDLLSFPSSRWELLYVVSSFGTLIVCDSEVKAEVKAVHIDLANSQPTSVEVKGHFQTLFRLLYLIRSHFYGLFLKFMDLHLAITKIIVIYSSDLFQISIYFLND